MERHVVAFCPSPTAEQKLIVSPGRIETLLTRGSVWEASVNSWPNSWCSSVRMLRGGRGARENREVHDQCEKRFICKGHLLVNGWSGHR